MAGYFSPRWQKDELQYLDRILHSYSFPQLVEKMQIWQKNHQLPVRSIDAIRQKAYKLGRKPEFQEDYLSKAQLARILDVPIHRVQLWIHRGLPKTQKHRNREVSISIADFKQWARSSADYLYGIERDRLSYLLSDKTIDLIPLESPFCRRVKCLDNGRTFATVAEAARAIGVNKVTLARAIEAGRCCGGYGWAEIKSLTPLQSHADLPLFP
jgi:hypothetical protein